jgi:DnaJ-class molecular chaperone
MADPYKTLDVAKTATQKEIQKAYRKLAKKLHPDVNPGDKLAEDQFKQVSAAYAIIGDEENRGRYDRGEIDDDGVEVPVRDPQWQRTSRSTENRFHQGPDDFAGFGNINDLFTEYFPDMGRGSERPRKGQDLRYKLDVGLVDAGTGATKIIRVGSESLDLKIPAGVKDGQVLRLNGKGQPGSKNGPSGDLLIELHVLPDKRFSLDGDNLRTEVPISIREAVLGGRVEVPTLTGSVAMTVPPNSSSGKALRLKGKGYPNKHGGHGDMLVSLKIVLPPIADEGLVEFMQGWHESNQFNPRNATSPQ